MSAQTHAACTWEQRTRISNLVTRDFVALNEKRITSSSLPSKEKRFDCLLESVDAGNFQGPSFEWLNRRVWHIGLCCGARQSRWMSRWDEGIYWMGVLYRSGKWKIEASSYICFWSGRFLISWNRRSQVCRWAHSSVRNTVEVKKITSNAIVMNWCNRHVQALLSFYWLLHSTYTTILPLPLHSANTNTLADLSSIWCHLSPGATS